MTNIDFSNTRCFIDFDGTIANSLNWYNEGLDDLVMGKLTDKHYHEYYQDFGDTYDLIPGCPWLYIVVDLVQYLSKSHIVSFLDNTSTNRFYKKNESYDIGEIDALMKVIYDAEFIEQGSIIPFVIYGNNKDRYIVILNEKTSIEDIIEITSRYKSDNKTMVLCSNEQANVLEEQNIEAEVITYRIIAKELHDIFEQAAIKHLEEKSYEQLSIEPVIQFLKKYKQAGGRIYIHSGSNRSFVGLMLSKLGIADLFDDIVCSSMMSREDMDAYEEQWGGYKVLLFDKLLEKYPAEKDVYDFVMGDTKGDAFGAYKHSMPFFLVWRGYPADPNRIQFENDNFIEPGGYVNVLQERLDIAFKEGTQDSAFNAEIFKMMQFAELVSLGEAKPLALVSNTDPAK